MRPIFSSIATALALCLVLAWSASAQETEQDIVNKYLNHAVVKHTKRIGWASASFGLDRINRNNDYNKLADIESAKLTNGDFNWLDNGMSIGLDFGLILKERFAWSIGGEYWLEMGEELAADTYLQVSTSTSVSAIPTSKVRVLGASTGLGYYLFNPPSVERKLDGISVKVGGTVGFYAASWDLWSEFENLNLATSAPNADNTTFKGSAPGFTLNLGADYPIGLWDLALGVDASYLYLNFNNMAWYNSQDQEVVVSLNGTEDGRVDLNLSGVKGRVELKRFFAW